MERKSLYTKKLGRIVAKNAKPEKSGKYHVISGIRGNWAVVPEGSVEAVRAFSTISEAISFAKQTASRKTGEVVIHDESGQVKDIISF